MINAERDQALFRSEALSAGSKNRMGSVLLSQPFGYTVIALTALFLVFLIVAYSYFGTYTRKSTVTGLLIPEQGMLRLASNGLGFISEIKVEEGQSVDAGDVLFVISSERISALGGTQYLIAEQLKQRLRLLEKNRSLANDRLSSQQRMLKNRLQAIDEELMRFQEELRLLERRVHLSKMHLQRQEELAITNFISIAQLHQAETELLTLQGQQQTLQRARASLLREQADLISQQEELELRHKSDISDIDNSIAIVKQEQAENDVRAEYVSVAPFKGFITGVNVQMGQQVHAGTLLASLIPHDAKLVAHVYVSPKQAGFLEPGQTALMRYASYPYQKFGMAKGRVLDIAKSPYALQELPPHIMSALKGQAEELFYRVTVEPESQDISVYGSAHPLRAGLLLEADIVQEKRRLYEWALEPIYSVTGKFSD